MKNLLICSMLIAFGVFAPQVNGQNTGCAKALFNDQINDPNKPIVVTDDGRCVIINAEIALQNKVFDFTRECSNIANRDNGGNGLWFVTSSCITPKSRIMTTYKYQEGRGTKGILSVEMVELGNGQWGFYIRSETSDGQLNTSDNHDINWFAIS